MASNPVKRYWTIEEYLAHEQETGIKHEFIDGEIYAMTGGTDKHSLIKSTLNAELVMRVKRPCRVYDSDMRVKINDTRYVYPDLSVVCGKALFADEKHTILLNPSLVVEVMSETSANYDKGAKADYYRSLGSVQAYLLLDQDSMMAQLYTRQEKIWTLEEFTGSEAKIPFKLLGFELSLGEIYRNVDFDEES